MGFFEDLGELVKKYNFEIHAVQLEENVKILNDRFRLALRKEDLPPPVILLRTSEGDFISSVLGPVTIRNEQNNASFINVKDNSVHTLFPVEKKEEVKEQVKVEVEEKPKKRGRKSKKETAPVTEEVKIEAKKEQKIQQKEVKIEPVKDEELNPEEEKQVVDTLNKLADAMEGSSLSWGDVPQKVEEKPIKVERAKSDRYLIISNIYKDANHEMGSYSKFIEKHSDTVLKFDILINLYEKFLEEKNFTELKTTSKIGKEVIEKVENEIKNNFDKVVVLDNYKKSPTAKKIVADLKKKGIDIIEEKDF